MTQAVHRSTRLLLVVCLAVPALAGSTGCSISASSESISDSISSPFESSSGASAQLAAYLRDVDALAFAFAKEGGELGALQREVSRLAQERGIADWQEDAASCASLGRGFGRADMARPRFEATAQALFAHNDQARSELERGYASVAP